MIEVPLLTEDSTSSWLVPHFLGHWKSGKQLIVSTSTKNEKIRTYTIDSTLEILKKIDIFKSSEMGVATVSAMNY